MKNSKARGVKSKEAEMKTLRTLLFVSALVTPVMAFAQGKKVSREVVTSKDARQPIGPYSQAI
jgi:hypothetical protein